MTELATTTTTALALAEQMAIIGKFADHFAAQNTFTDYTQRKAKNTVDAQRFDLAAFVQFLESAGAHGLTAEQLQTAPGAWYGVTWGIVKGFVEWQFKGGVSVASINRRLSTVKTYAKLAAQAGAIPADALTLIQTVRGYNQKEAMRVNEGRTVTRVGKKKAQHVSITDKQAEQLRAQPLDTPVGRRDAVLMALLLDNGLRAGELSALTVDSIDLHGGALKGFYRAKVNKTQNHDLSADALKALRAYFDSGDVPAVGPLLRGSRKGGKLDQAGMSETAISERVRKLGADLGIDGLSAHDCRHYWATYWGKRVEKLPKGVFTLQEAGGWNSLSMPRRYVDQAATANEGMV